MIDISKEYINTFLDIVNINSNSTIRSKKAYGTFEILESINETEMEVNMELVYIPQRPELIKDRGLDGNTKSLIRKCYDLEVATIDDFRSAFYYEVITYLTGSKSASNLINYGEY